MPGVYTTLMLILVPLLLVGCAAPVSVWRDDALSRFSTALAAGSQSYAPEETESIRQALMLGDRYLQDRMIEDADRFYQLSCQKSQLLYRSLILGKIRQGTSLLVDSGKNSIPVEIVVSREPLSIRDALEQAVEEESAAKGDPDTKLSVPVRENMAVAVLATADSSPKTEKTTELVKLLPDGGDPAPVNSSKEVESRDDPPLTVKSHSPKPVRIRSKAKVATEIPPPRLDPAGTTIYLTFDDGPSRLTLPVASYLKSQGIAATFFVLGNNIKGHQSTIRATVAMGHRVGNHTLSHDLRKLDASFNQAVSEVGRTAAMVDKLGGDGRMVRIPFGASTKTMISRVASEGGQIFDWDINSNDSTKRGARDHVFIERTVLTQLDKCGKRHIILLFHDGAGHETTLTALRNLVPALKAKGYKFGLLSRNEQVAKK